MNESALVLEICRQFSERHTATLVSILRTSSSLRYLNCGPGHIQYNYSSTYSGFNIQMNVPQLLLEICRQFNAPCSAIFVPNTSLRYLNCGPYHIQCTYSSTYSGLNIQLNVSALLYEIYRQLYVRYTANFVPNTAHMFQFALSELWSRTYTMYLHFRIFRLQYSTEVSSPAVLGIPTIQCALYCKLGAKYCAHPPVYAM
jgi:hypothetical protein